MKKVLLAFAILGFVACNNEGEGTTATDSTTVAPQVDSVAAPVDSVAAPVDSVAAPAVDSTAK